MEQGGNGPRLTAAELDAIVKAASDAAIEKYKEEHAKEHEKRRKQVLNNTKVLMKNYRRFKEMTMNGVYGSEASANETLIELLETMRGTGGRDDCEVASIKDKVAKTSLILEHIDSMLDVYRKDCSRSIEGKRRYRVLEAMFLSDEPMAVGEIAEAEHVAERTVFRDIRIAYEELSVLLFGIDGVKHVAP